MAFTDSGYKDWKRGHCTLVCIHHADYDAMLDRMQPEFRKLNATVEELDEASLWLWEHPDELSRSWGEHGGLIRLAIWRRRKELKAAAERKARWEGNSQQAHVLSMKLGVPEAERSCPKCLKPTPVSKLTRNWCDTCCAEFDLIKKKG